MAQSKMADAVLADGRSTGYARELAAPSADWFLRMNHAGGGLGGADFTRNAGALYSSVGDYAGDQRAVLVDKDRVGELVHAEVRNTGAPYSRASGFARGHVALLVDQDRAGGLPLGGVADFLVHDTAEHFAGLGALYSSNGGVARGHGHGAPLLDKDRAGELPLGGVADFLERDMAAPHTSAGVVVAREHGVPFDKAQSVGTAAGAAPSSPNAAQITIDVDIVAEATAAKAAAGGGGGNLASAVLGIVTASSAVTMVAAGDVSPPVAFGLFVLMIAGLSLAVAGVRRV